MDMQNDKAHLTAIGRSRLSVPARVLSEKGLIKGRVLDYGCGRGGDADRLGCERYDPHYFPNKPEGRFDTILCTYVLNVVDSLEAAHVLQDIRALLKTSGMAFVAVRRDVEDGFTSKGTYQRNVVMHLPEVASNSSYCIYEMEGK